MRQQDRRKLNNKGAAMILSICVLAVVIVLCLSLLLVSSVVLNNAQSRLAKEQSRVLAVSFSKQLEEEIEQPPMDEEGNVPKADGLWQYIRQNVNTGSWPYYNEDEPGHTKRFAYRTYQVDTNSVVLPEDGKMLADGMSVTMYWTSESGADPGSSDLVVEVTATRNEQSSTITSTYSLDITPGATQEDELWQWNMNWRE